MAEIRFMELTDAELEGYLNNAIHLLAVEMAKDGIVATEQDITNRYLALVVRKKNVAQMFRSMFKDNDTDNRSSIAVVRVERNETK